jgi:hypothetical protein
MLLLSKDGFCFQQTISCPSYVLLLTLQALESFRKQEVDYLIATDVAARVSDSFQQHHLLTLRSGVAEYVIFFTTLYDIIFL